MKKLVVLAFVVMLVMSTFASAGFWDWITGAPVADTNVPPPAVGVSNALIGGTEFTLCPEVTGASRNTAEWNLAAQSTKYAITLGSILQDKAVIKITAYAGGNSIEAIQNKEKAKFPDITLKIGESKELIKEFGLENEMGFTNDIVIKLVGFTTRYYYPSAGNRATKTCAVVNVAPPSGFEQKDITTKTILPFGSIESDFVHQYWTPAEKTGIKYGFDGSFPSANSNVAVVKVTSQTFDVDRNVNVDLQSHGSITLNLFESKEIEGRDGTKIWIRNAGTALGNRPYLQVGLSPSQGSVMATPGTAPSTAKPTAVTAKPGLLSRVFGAKPVANAPAANAQPSNAVPPAASGENAAASAVIPSVPGKDCIVVEPSKFGTGNNGGGVCKENGKSMCIFSFAASKPVDCSVPLKIANTQSVICC